MPSFVGGVNTTSSSSSSNNKNNNNSNSTVVSKLFLHKVGLLVLDPVHLVVDVVEFDLLNVSHAEALQDQPTVALENKRNPAFSLIYFKTKSIKRSRLWQVADSASVVRVAPGDLQAVVVGDGAEDLTQN